MSGVIEGSDARPVLVSGATGTVGREVVRALLERGVPVRVLVRSALRVAHLPVEVERVIGDLRDPRSIRLALAGARSAFYVSPHEADEEALAENFIAACEAMHVRLVFAGVHVEVGPRPVRRLLQWWFGRRFPHYRPKFRIGERARTSTADPVVLMAGTFAQNDELFLDEILAGRFVQPMRTVNHVDVRDVGDAAARALTDPSLPGGAYPLSSPGVRSGPECAAVWSAALGRMVRFTGDDMVAFEQLLPTKLDGRKLHDFTRTYRIMSRMKMPAPSAREVKQTEALLGRPPRTYEEYVRDVAASVRSATAA